MSSFYQLVESLLREPGERAAYLADPSGYLPSHGFGDFSPEDVELSMQLVADSVPPALAELLDPAAGLDSVMAVDIDEVPGLFERAYDSSLDDPPDDRTALEEIVGEDDPFFDDESPTNNDQVDDNDEVRDSDVVDEPGTDLDELAEIGEEHAVADEIGLDSHHDSAEISDELTTIDTPVLVAVDEGFAGDDVAFDSPNTDELDVAAFDDAADPDLEDLFE